MKTEQFAYTPVRSFPGGMPFVNLQLGHKGYRISVAGLVDSGSALNILPFDVGLELGLDWEKQEFSLEVGGSLKGIEAYAVLVKANIAEFPSVDLAFAWLRQSSLDVPVLLGQVNFFQEYNVCFYGHRRVFEIVPRSH